MKKHSKLVIRIFSFLLAAVLFMSPLTFGMEAHAANEAVLKTGTTTASYLFVRSGAGSTYKRVGGLWRGTPVEILEEKGAWYRIDSGWISSEYVKVEGAAASTTPTTSTSTKTGNATVTASLLFVRRDPSTNYTAIGMLRKGDRIEVLETNGNWLKIKAGWVYSEYVAMDNGGSLYSEKKNAIVTANELNVRQSPSTKAAIVGSLRINQRVEVLETSGEWIRTNYGWVNKNFVELVDSASANNTGKVTSMGLNVRKGPGTNYARVATLRIGEKVTILENQGEWLRISSGWVNANYIKIGG
ncbi:MAG: SH3 domain-containing protein [Oscillospiraceae bacterium]|nr:SH3 domain-containing protein [Oscillospiraceae bacterium]